MINEQFISWFVSEFRKVFATMDSIVLVSYQGISLSVLDIMIGTLLLTVIFNLLIPTSGGDIDE